MWVWRNLQVQQWRLPQIHPQSPRRTALAQALYDIHIGIELKGGYGKLRASVNDLNGLRQPLPHDRRTLSIMSVDHPLQCIDQYIQMHARI
jgi:hypothetical protein